jgi:hypothetical protein
MGLEGLEKLEPVERDDKPVDDDHIFPDRLPPTRSVLIPPETLPKVWGLSSQRILVRSEYHEAERAALLANETDKRVFAVTGQPGIGTPLLLSIPCRI